MARRISTCQIQTTHRKGVAEHGICGSVMETAPGGGGARAARVEITMSPLECMRVIIRVIDVWRTMQAVVDKTLPAAGPAVFCAAGRIGGHSRDLMRFEDGGSFWRKPAAMTRFAGHAHAS